MAASAATGSVLNALHALLIRGLAFTANSLPTLGCFPAQSRPAGYVQLIPSSPLASKQNNCSQPFSLPAHSPPSVTPSWGWNTYAMPSRCMPQTHSPQHWQMGKERSKFSPELSMKCGDKGHDAENFATTPFLKQWGLTELPWVCLRGPDVQNLSPSLLPRFLQVSGHDRHSRSFASDPR